MHGVIGCFFDCQPQFAKRQLDTMVTKVDRMIARLMASLIIALAVARCEGGESSVPTAPTSSVCTAGFHE
jgi:hypothetical protein